MDNRFDHTPRGWLRALYDLVSGSGSSEQAVATQTWHPIFGSMSERAWLRWGYLHVDPPPAAVRGVGFTGAEEQRRFGSAALAAGSAEIAAVTYSGTAELHE